MFPLVVNSNSWGTDDIPSLSEFLLSSRLDNTPLRRLVLDAIYGAFFLVLLSTAAVLGLLVTVRYPNHRCLADIR
jgi:hypothetical protein